MPNIEKGLETYRSTDSITFLDYLYYLKVELFNQSSSPPSPSRQQSLSSSSSSNNDNKPQKNELNANVDLSKVNEVCWMLCSSKYLSRDTTTTTTTTRQKRLRNDDDVYRLWRLFNFVSETDGEGEVVYPVVTHVDEVRIIVTRVWSIAGQIFDDDAFREACGDRVELEFPRVLELLENTFLDGLDEDVVSPAIKEVYDEYIVEVLKKVRSWGGWGGGEV